MTSAAIDNPPGISSSGQPATVTVWGGVGTRQYVSTEVNTVFQNLVGVIDKIDVAKLNAVLTAFASGVRGQGERIGEATTHANRAAAVLHASPTGPLICQTRPSTVTGVALTVLTISATSTDIAKPSARTLLTNMAVSSTSATAPAGRPPFA